MDWFLRLQETPRDERMLEEFAAWLGRSPEHEKAWEKACRSWELIGQVPPVHRPLWHPEPAAIVSPPVRKPWRAWGMGTAAAAACLALSIAWSDMRPFYEADYATHTAEIRKITLEDASTVELSAGSAINADITDTSRRLDLLSGEAFFEVAPDPERPFVVTAGGVKVTAIGTAFNVKLSSSETTVELAEGLVDLSMDGAARTSFELSPGEMVVVDRESGAMKKESIAGEDIASWRSGRLFVKDATIGSVVEELQRYHPAWVKIPSSSLAAQRVTGLYDLKDPDRALRALVEPYGGKVHRISPYLRILAFF
ncbi:MAG: FecR family protein [Shinella sp.]|nr:FecR family protein [Shinella sp.]